MFNQDDMGIISNSVLFKNVPDKISQVLLVDSRQTEIPAGQTLFIQGESAKSMFVVLEGWIKLTRLTKSGDEVVVTVYSSGESFGEAAALQGGLYPVSAEAVTDCRLVKIKAKTVLKAIRTKPELAVAMLSCTFRHLHELVMQIEDMKARSGVKRLAAFLIALSLPDAKGNCTFPLPYDKSLIAARLGMKPESLSRAFAKLRDIGVIVAGNKITITDVKHLHRYVEEDRPRTS